MKKVLITGASGFIGNHLVQAALDEGLLVYAGVRQGSDVSLLNKLKVNLAYLDYTDVNHIVNFLQKENCHYVVHAAGVTKAKDVAQYDTINATYTKNLALATSMVNYALEKFVFISSLASLGPLSNFTELLQDQSPPFPVTKYGNSKLLAEILLKQVTNLPLIVLRPTAVYGPGEKDILILIKTMNKGLEPYIGRTAQQLSFIYVKDLAKITISALKSNVSGKSYNISDGKIYSRYDFTDSIKRALQKKTIRFHIPIALVNSIALMLDWLYRNNKKEPVLNSEKMKELTALNWGCSIENIAADLGFKPGYGLDQGLKETISWYKQHNWIK